MTVQSAFALHYSKFLHSEVAGILIKVGLPQHETVDIESGVKYGSWSTQLRVEHRLLYVLITGKHGIFILQDLQSSLPHKNRIKFYKAKRHILCFWFWVRHLKLVPNARCQWEYAFLIIYGAYCIDDLFLVCKNYPPWVLGIRPRPWKWTPDPPDPWPRRMIAHAHFFWEVVPPAVTLQGDGRNCIRVYKTLL